jgi:uncharacterized protein (TIGR03790 family)
LIALGVFLAASASAQPPPSPLGRHVLVVINSSSADSVDVGEHYVRARGLAADQVVRIQVEPRDEVTRDEYLRRIETPIAQWIQRTSAQDRTLFIVLTKGVPLRIAGTPGRSGTLASVDSELTLLYRKMAGRPEPATGRVDNPYSLGTGPVLPPVRFTHERFDIYLVTRLDGFTAADARGLVDRALRAQSDGAIVLDQKAAVKDVGNSWLEAAATRLGEVGFGSRVVLETTSEVVTRRGELLGYYSWGSSDPAIKVRTFGFEFLPGAIGGMFVSSDARTFREPPAEWTIGTWENRASYYEGSPQSLAGDLVREGITGLSAYVGDPFLDATIRPDVLFPSYLSGLTLAEAYYRAMPALSWTAVVIGDPLCAVVPGPAAATAALDPPLDPATELPAHFSARRLAAVVRPGVSTEAARLVLRADARLARDDRNGAKQALAQAIAADPRLVGARLALASLHEVERDYRAAIDQYRAIVDLDGNNVVALNNLAYALAARVDRAADAVPFGQRAYTLARGNPTIADTLGWVLFLNGDKAQAAKYLAEAVRGEPTNPEIRYHAAALADAAGDLESARRELTKALELDASLAQRDEVRALAGKLSVRLP